MLVSLFRSAVFPGSLSALPLLLLGGCLSFSPSVDIVKNPAGADLEQVDTFSVAFGKELTDYIETNTRFDACIVMIGDKVAYQYGDIHTPLNCASVRKSVFSALYGIAAEKGLIDLDASLGELGINDSVNPLTETEKTATIRHLLTARSGVYLPSSGESEGMKRRKPARGAFLPGEHFYYNNWDFNALPIILERVTGKTTGELINEWLAVPLGMKDFVPSNLTYQFVDFTEYPQTRLYISAEDLARFSSLYVTDGRWNGQEVIPANWVTESTIKVSSEPQDADLVEHPFMEGYAYLWWVDEDENTFWADGAGGHFCIVDRARNMTVVLRNNTGLSTGGLIFYNAENPYMDNEAGNEVYKLIKSQL